MRTRSRPNKQLLRTTSDQRWCGLRKELVRVEIELQKSLNNHAFCMEQKVIESIKRNPKYFFSYVKKFAKVKSNINPLQKPNQKFTDDPKEMADLLANQYTRVFSVPEDTPSDINRLFSDQKIWQFKDIIFSIKDVLEEIKNTSPSAASGPDGLPIILLQKCPSLGLPLHIFWTKCWEEEVAVQSLKEPIIIPIHKGGSKGASEKYRPISLTSHVVKIFERIIRKRIVNYIESNVLFNSSQHGFRVVDHV